MKLIIEIIDGKWKVNGKSFQELSLGERTALANFIKDFDYEKATTPD